MEKLKNINWKLRLKNKATLSGLVGIVVMAAFSIAKLFGLELSITQEQVMQTVDFLLLLLASWGVIVDPTTAGTADSSEALEREAPKGSEQND